jgi:uncharacterized repeat protein (TIGR01451 family)
VVTIHANPTVAISPDPAEVCEGVNLQLFGNPAGGSGSYTTHSWTGAGATYLDDITAENPIFNHITPGTYSLTYTVTDSNSCTSSDSIDVVVHDYADLVVTKSIDDPSPNEGDTITYTVTLTNNGPCIATNIVITDSLPAGVTYSSNTPSQGSYDSGSGAWSAGSLANGASATLDISATVDAGTATQTITNTASVASSDQTDTVPANNSDSAALTVQGADLAVTKIVDDSAPNEGDTITYTITLTNNGPDTATNIVISDLLPAGVTYSSDTASQGTYDDSSGLWTVGTRANGASATLDISATVDAGTAAQTITNTASVTSVDQGDQTPANNSDSAALTVQSADLAVTKTVDDPIPNEGDIITYTVTLTNNGPDTATSIVISDLLPAGVTYSSNTPSQGTYISGSGAWSVGTLANGASATLDISATVDPGTAAQTITNTASVSNVDQADTIPANNSDSAAQITPTPLHSPFNPPTSRSPKLSTTQPPTKVTPLPTPSPLSITAQILPLTSLSPTCYPQALPIHPIRPARALMPAAQVCGR